MLLLGAGVQLLPKKYIDWYAYILTRQISVEGNLVANEKVKYFGVNLKREG